MFTQDDIYRRWERHIKYCEENGQNPQSFDEFISDFYDLWEG